MSKRDSAGMTAAPGAGGVGVASEVGAASPARERVGVRTRREEKPDIARFIRRTRSAMAGELYYGEPLPEPDETMRRELRATGAMVREMWEKVYAKWPDGPPYERDRKKAMAELRAMQAREWPEGSPRMGDFSARTRAATARVFSEGDEGGDDAGG